MCFVCGLENPFGLRASFYETKQGALITLFEVGQEHQGYPERLHGGIAAAVLDEAIGRNINMGKTEQLWGVTIDFHIRYKKPIPLGKKLKAVTRLTEENKRFFKGAGEVLLPDGKIAAQAKGKYLKMPIQKIASRFTVEHDDWRVIQSKNDPKEIQLP